MTHYLIVKLNENIKVEEYLSVAKPIFDKMVEEIEGFISYDVILNVASGPNNFDVMVKMNLENSDALMNYKPHYLHKLLKEKTDYCVGKKAIFDC